MSQIVLKKSTAELQQMKTHYQALLSPKQPPGSIFTAKTNNCTITAYKSGKVLFQGAGCQSEADKWGAPIAKSHRKRKPACQKDPNYRIILHLYPLLAQMKLGQEITLDQ